MGSIYQPPPPTIVKQVAATQWQPDVLWPDMEALLSRYAGGYASRMGCIVSDGSATLELTGAAAYRTSDAPDVLDTAGGTHTWNDTNIAADSQGRKFRWVIYYYNSVDVALTTVGMVPLDSRYVVFDSCNLTDLTCFKQTVATNALVILESFDLIRNASTASITDWSLFCMRLYSLVRLPDNLDTSNGTDFSNFCQYCYSLPYLPETLNTSKGTNFSSFCHSCYSLRCLPENLDVSNATNVSNFCNSNYSLKRIGRNFAISGATNTGNLTVFVNCYTLENLSDGFNITYSGSFTAPQYWYAMSGGWIADLRVAINLSSSPRLSVDFILNTMRDAQTVATARTFTIGAANLAKVAGYTAEIAAFEAKNWTLA